MQIRIETCIEKERPFVFQLVDGGVPIDGSPMRCVKSPSCNPLLRLSSGRLKSFAAPSIATESCLPVAPLSPPLVKSLAGNLHSHTCVFSKSSERLTRDLEF